MPQSESKSVTPEVEPSLYAVGIDMASEKCTFCVLTADKRVMIKPLDIENTAVGFAALLGKLEQLEAKPGQILIGMEATARYWENLYHFLVARGYRVCLLHPAQTRQFAQQRGLRAKTDRLDAQIIARVLLSGDARPVYVPDEITATYRELVRLRTNLKDEAARYKMEIGDLLVVLFPEFTQVFADPCAPTARALLKRYPGAQAFVAAGVETIVKALHELAPRRYGQTAAQQLVSLAEYSVTSGVACSARAKGLRILCDQLSHTQANLDELEQEIDRVLSDDAGTKGLQSVPEFGAKTVAALRAELGDVTRFERSDQVVAYVGLDLTVKQSGKWKGQTKLSKRGNGSLRRILYMAALSAIRSVDSAFGVYYRRLVERGMKGRCALMAVMRKMVVVAYTLLKEGGRYDPQKVCTAAIPPAQTVLLGA